MKQYTRRELITKAACVGICWLSACEQNSGIKPRVGKIELMHISKVPLGLSILSVERLVLLRDEKGIGVFSLVCTHQTCLLEKEDSDGGFQCPCHGSRFDSFGKVLNGPAIIDLPWYALEINKNGIIEVDFSRVVSRDFRL
jgi:Rieske Fe-S protein